MVKTGKKFLNAKKIFEGKHDLSLDEAVNLVKNNASAKFDETVDIAINLGVDPKHADQMVRGVCALPHGNGKNVRDWLYVEDHVCALDLVFHNGKNGETYNIGSNNELSNIDLVYKICDIFLDKDLIKSPHSLIQFVPDRLGHDRRYAIDYSKLSTDLNWSPRVDFDQGLLITVDWYLDYLKG